MFGTVGARQRCMSDCSLERGHLIKSKITLPPSAQIGRVWREVVMCRVWCDERANVDTSNPHVCERCARTMCEQCANNVRTMCAQAR